MKKSYFSTLVRSDVALTSGFNFPFVTSTPFSMCYPVDVQTTHSKRILSFLHLWILWTGQSNFSDFFSSSFFKMEDLQLSTLQILVFFFSKTRKSMNMPISASKKEHLSSRIKDCFSIITVAHTKTLDEIVSFENNRQVYMQYIVLYIYLYIYIYIYMWLYGYIYIYIYIHIYLVICVYIYMQTYQ